MDPADSPSVPTLKTPRVLACITVSTHILVVTERAALMPGSHKGQGCRCLKMEGT